MPLSDEKRAAIRALMDKYGVPSGITDEAHAEAARRAAASGESGDAIPSRYEVIVYRLPVPQSGGPWLVRCYDAADGRHVHSAEGGVSLNGGLREVERAINRDQGDDHGQ